MRVLSVKKGTTYTLNIGRVPFFYIYDKKGREYYGRENCGKDTIKVNFPIIGDFRTSSDFIIEKEEDLVIKKPTFELPKNERRRFKEFEIKDNFSFRSPARIHTHNGIVETGKNFYKFSIPQRVFILLHELGHFFYKTEWKCDLFAYYHFIELGYNNSQAFYSLSKVLHDTEENRERIHKLFKTILKHEKR